MDATKMGFAYVDAHSTDSVRAWVTSTRRVLTDGATAGRTVIDGALDRLDIVLDRLAAAEKERDAALARAERAEAERGAGICCVCGGTTLALGDRWACLDCGHHGGVASDAP